MLVVEVQVGKRAFETVESAFGHVEAQLADVMDGVSKPLSRVMRDTLLLVHKKMVAQHGGPWNGGVVNNSSNLQKRSGGGLASIRKSISVTGSGAIASLAGRISTGSMGVHETGATIQATRAKYLTIPLPPALDPRGVPLRKRARDWDNTFVARSRKGNLIIFQKKGRKNITPLYLLKTSVTIKPRLRMEETIIGDALPYFDRRALAALERHIERAIG